MPRIAYFGPQGTFTEQAALRFEGELVPVETIPLAFAALRKGETEFACVPIENSVEGAVPATLDALVRDEPVVAVAETVLDVRFSILVRPGTREIRTIASHPHALAQVREWIAAELPGVTSIATSSTAAAAAAVDRGEFDAAVTAPVAVHHYALEEFAVDVLGATCYFDDRFEGPAVEELLDLRAGEGFRATLFRGPRSRNARLEFIEALTDEPPRDVVPRAIATIEVADLELVLDRLGDGRHGSTTPVVAPSLDGVVRPRVGVATRYGAHLDLVQASPDARR